MKKFEAKPLPSEAEMPCPHGMDMVTDYEIAKGIIRSNIEETRERLDFAKEHKAKRINRKDK